jgi:hypothetical protein
MSNTNTTNTEVNAVKVVRRFEYLSNLISKYKHLWTESDRLYKWVDEYNNLRSEQREIFNKYCEKHGYCTTHTAHDTLA